MELNFWGILETRPVLVAIIVVGVIPLVMILFTIVSQLWSERVELIRESYTPTSFQMDDRQKMFDFVDEVASGLIVVSDESNRMISSFVPLLLDRSKGLYGTLYGHIANQNDMCELFGRDCLITFAGPHGYISPKFYGDIQDRMVPTWNYAMVECRGKLKEVTGLDKDVLFAEMISREENKIHPDNKWDMKQVDSKILDPMKSSITWFQILVDNMNGRFKLSQNRTKLIRDGMYGPVEKVNPSLASLMKNFN